MTYNYPEEELKILKFWQENKIFEKTLEKTKKSKNFSFYDGPPFATGLPHYGHILSSVAKDAIPRYKTMQNFFVARRWGWDCHGLPIENIVEKELGISGKKDIEDKIGVEKFNEICRSKVLMYCPRCETPVSKAEVAMDNSYKNVTEEAVTVKFKIKNSQNYFLAWTTTPWTLPANVALAVGEKIKYVLVKAGGENFILAKDRVAEIFKNKEYKIEKEFLGKELIGIEYEPLYEIDAVKISGKKSWQVLAADFVNTDEGTGIVHTAVIYGEDDFNLGKKFDLPMAPLLQSNGVFNKDAPAFIKNRYFKDSEKDIKADLLSRGLLFSKNQNTHPYPFCWRCGTQLFYNAISAWFINIQKDKKKIIKLNEKINWYPEHLKNGRFLNILEDAPDWNISRNRYWATPLPFFKCECGNAECIGSVKELKEKAVNFAEVYNTDKV